MTYNPRCRLVSGALEEEDEEEEEGEENNYSCFYRSAEIIHPPDVTYGKKHLKERGYLTVARRQTERTLAAAAESEAISP